MPTAEAFLDEKPSAEDFLNQPSSPQIKLDPYQEAYLTTQAQGRPMLNPSADVNLASESGFAGPGSLHPGELTREVFQQLPQDVGNVARGVGSDILLMTPNESTFANTKAALYREPLPIDKDLAELAKTDPVTATAGHVAQDLMGFAPMAPALAAGGWPLMLVLGGQVLSEAPEQVKELGEELGKLPVDQDKDKIARLRAQLLQTTAFTALPVGHMAGKLAKPSVTPLVTEPAGSSPTGVPTVTPVEPAVLGEKGQPNAIPVGETTAVPVGQTPGSSQEVGTRISGTEKPADVQTQVPSNVQGEGAAEVKPQTRILNRQYGDFPKGTQVTLTGQESTNPMNRWVEAILPDGTKRQVPPEWLKQTSSPIGTLPQLIKQHGRDHVEQMIGEWDNNAHLSEDGKSITGYADPRNQTGKQKLSTREFLEWLQSDAGKSVLNPESAASGEIIGTGGATPSSQQGKGIAASVRGKWTNATSEGGNFGSEAGFFTLQPVKDLIDYVTPHAKAAVKYIHDLGVEQGNIRRVDDYTRSVLNWSSKLQRSFGEAASAAHEIKTKVPDRVRREGITNWIQAGGDPAILAARFSATADPKLKAGYQAALTLTPDEIAVANDVKQAYDALGQRGQQFDVLSSFVDNYVTQIWNLRRGPQGIGSSRQLREKFKFSKARTFPTFFDGEQAGYQPKTKDIAKLLPVYLHEMNSVIAARQLVKQMAGGVASDGRPLLSPRGSAASVTDAQGDKATLVFPKTAKADTADYKVLSNHPALQKWKWVSEDAAGNPVMLKGDLALHPEAYDKLRNVLGKSAIREWYQSKTSLGAEIPKGIVRAFDFSNQETKRTMLGLLSPFHQVQEGTHAIGHRVNPFRAKEGGFLDRTATTTTTIRTPTGTTTITTGGLPDAIKLPKIDLVNNAGQLDAAKHGLMLQPDRVSADQFMEGFRQSGLVSKIPGIGPLADHYANYLFHEYIPGLKYKTYEAILDRNQKVYSKELANGSVKLEDVKVLSAEQANAAYGHLNYTLLARNPTVQHFMQLGLLAPDFLEARARFTGQSIKGATGLKVGREQLVALATLAVAQAAGSYMMAKAVDGEWDHKHPFEFTKGNRRYTFRSVPEDMHRLMTDWRQFTHNRLSPIIGKGALQLGTGKDWRGQNVTVGQTLKELATQPIPLTLRGALGVGNTPLTGWEQLMGAAGLKIQRYSPQHDVYDMVNEWRSKSDDPKIRAQYERAQKETLADSDYKPLRDALVKNDTKAAIKEYQKLLDERGKEPEDIDRAMSAKKRFAGTIQNEEDFVDSLTREQKKTYEAAIKEREELEDRYDEMLKKVP